MEKLTKEDAIKECIRIWSEIANDPTITTSKKENKYDEYENGCPCCEYVRINTDDSPGSNTCFQVCPIKWLDTDEIYLSLCHCENEQSTYSKWRKAKTPKLKTKYALEIVRLAEKALEKEI